jgi:hypothetical protein
MQRTPSAMVDATRLASLPLDGGGFIRNRTLRHI